MLEQILLSLYVLVIIAVCIRIVIDTNIPSKALAYILLVIIMPIFGVFFYFAVGLNYRKRKLYDRKTIIDENSFPQLQQQIDNDYDDLEHQLNGKSTTSIFYLNF